MSSVSASITTEDTALSEQPAPDTEVVDGDGVITHQNDG